MKKNVVIIILVILVLGLGGYLVYDKILDKDIEKENKEEVKELKVGDVGKINSEIEVNDCSDEKGTVKIEKGKLVYTTESGKRLDDTTIKEKVISVVDGLMGCDCAGLSFVALTEEGNVYYNILTQENEFKFKFNLKKVLSDEKIYGIDIFETKAPVFCAGQNFYAYVNENKEDARRINKYYETPYLGNTYYSLYPYEEFVFIDYEAPYLAIDKNGNLELIYFNGRDNGDDYIIYEGKYVQVNSKEDISIIENLGEYKYGYRIIDKNNNHYELTFTLNESYYADDLKLVKVK